MAHLRLRYIWIGCLAILLTLGTGRFAAQAPAAPPSVASCALPGQFSLSQAQRLYESGCYGSAATVLSGISHQGDDLTQAIAWSNLSLTQQQLGNWEDASQAIDQAFGHITQLRANKRAPIQAQALDVRGQLQLSRGQSAAAASSWQQAGQFYTQLQQPNRAALSQIKQAKALQSLGLFQQVKVILQDVEASLRPQPDSEAKAVALRQLADTLWTTGSIEAISEDSPPKTNIQDLLSQAEAIGSGLNRTDITAAVKLSEGNFYQHQFLSEISKPVVSVDHQQAYDYFSEAIRAYDQVEIDTGNRQLIIQARLNQLNLQVNPDFRKWLAETRKITSEQREELNAYLVPVGLQLLYDSITPQLDSLPNGRQAVYSRVNLAQSLMNWDQVQTAAVDLSDIPTLLAHAEAQARGLDDRRALSYVLGHRGKFYERTGQNLAAIELTQEALSYAQSVRAQDISYQWQSQLGRLLKAQGDMRGAIAAYTSAFETLQNLRTDLIAAHADQRFYFRDNIEPIYRELISLLLPKVPNQVASKANTGTVQSSQKDLDLARRVMDSLQVAELENFFQAACVDTKTELGEALEPGNAGIYPIVLDDRLEILMQLPTAASVMPNAADSQDSYTLRRFSSNVDKKEIQKIVDNTRTHLDAYAIGGIGSLRRNSQKLYSYMFLAKEVGGAEPLTLADVLALEMQDAQNPTLVFVLDGILRSIPMGVLYDGQQHVLEKYAIALNVGIEVRESGPLPKGDALRVLAAGVEDPPNNLPNLPNVPEELAEIYGSEASVQVLQENTFTQAAFNQQLNNANYQIVHLATHGTFSSNRDQTFIVAKDKEIPVEQLSELFRNTQAIQNPIEMIVFSACHTAEGDDRAVLGLAGATVQSGARSAIATLWSVDDEASVEFARLLYQNLHQPNMTRAVALQKAQLKMKEIYKSKNKFWAPYVLVGSWR